MSGHDGRALNTTFRAELEVRFKPQCQRLKQEGFAHAPDIQKPTTSGIRINLGFHLVYGNIACRFRAPKRPWTPKSPRGRRRGGKGNGRLKGGLRRSKAARGHRQPTIQLKPSHSWLSGRSTGWGEFIWPGTFKARRCSISVGRRHVATTVESRKGRHHSNDRRMGFGDASVGAVRADACARTRSVMRGHRGDRSSSLSRCGRGRRAHYENWKSHAHPPLALVDKPSRHCLSSLAGEPRTPSGRYPDDR